MKRLIYGVAFLAITGATVLVACDKQDVTPNKATAKTEAVSNIEKSGRLTDAQLIDIIKGRNADYSRVEEIEDVLFENCKLSSSVLRTLASDLRFPNYIVEEMAVLSAPISDADLSYLNSARPSLSTTAIIAAADIDLTHLNYMVVNTSPRQMLFAKNLMKKSLCADGCGESEIKGDYFVVLDLTSPTTPLEPAEMKPCKDGGKWICGTARRVRRTGGDHTTSHYQVTCTQSSDKCIKDVADAVRDYDH